MSEDTFVAQIDGQTFLSEEEVQQYYELRALMQEEEGEA